MQLAAPAVTHARSSDPIQWLFYELRGPAGSSAGGRWEQTTVELWARSGGDAYVTDGRMSYPHDPGVVEDHYWTIPHYVRDGIDPDHATGQSRAGAAALVAALELGAAQSQAFRVLPTGSRVPRMPDQLDVWIRRESGASERYLVPVDQLPAGMRDARAAAHSFTRTTRANYLPT